MNLKKLMTVACVLAATTIAPQANAMDDQTRGIVQGIAGYWIYNQLTQPRAPGYGYGGGMPGYGGGYPSMGGALPPVPLYYQPNCRQVLTVQIDRYGNEYRTPQTVCQ